MSKRKDDHLHICLKENVDRNGNFFDAFHLEHCALPEIDFSEIETQTTFLKKSIAAPLIINCMTGGTARAKTINERLAKTAAKYKLPLGLGSARVLLEKPETLSTFAVRHLAPDIPLTANIGAVQLNYGVDIKDLEKIIELLGADALCLHLNPLQEAIQPEGDTNFVGLLKKIENVVKKLSVPVVVKEVGAGISEKAARQLFSCGVKMIDISGRGGTSWALIEGKRRKNSEDFGNTFADWGIPTPQAIEECKHVKGLTIIASGGIRSGLDLAKALALGASYGAMALPFLEAATQGEKALAALVQKILYELKVAMFCTGSKNITALQRTRCI